MPSALRRAVPLASRRVALRPAPPREPAIGIAPSRETVLAVEGLSLSFGGVRAFADIDLTVRAGEIHAVIGPNGAGKSSLINAISGVCAPQSGRIRLRDGAFSRVPPGRLAALGVARTFQNLALFKGLSVLDNVLTGLSQKQRSGLAAQWLGLPAARREAREHETRARETIALLELDALGDRLVGGLPYGVQKRVELARALVARPALLLLDEPMAGMSATEKGQMSRFIRASRDAYGTAIVLIEHDIGVVMRLSDRVTVLDHGHRIATGTPAEVRADPAVVAAYLGVEPDDVIAAAEFSA